VRIIYLDQNKWIDLARGAHAPADYPRERAALAAAVEAARAGRSRANQREKAVLTGRVLCNLTPDNVTWGNSEMCGYCDNLMSKDD
jgi:hypothetical protein